MTQVDEARAADDQRIQDRLAWPSGSLGFRQAVRARRDLRRVDADADPVLELVNENWD